MNFVLGAMFTAQILISFDQSHANTWDYTISLDSYKSSIVTTSRAYLKVDFDGKKIIRRIAVTSDCTKPFGEPVYGMCQHKITDANGKSATLSTGEEVGLVSFGKKSLLSTLEYSCCGSPNRIRVYTDAGKELGFFETFETPRTTIDSTWNFGATDIVILRTEDTAELVLLYEKDLTP